MSDRLAAPPVRFLSLLSLLIFGLSFAYLLTYPLALGRADESHLLHGAKRILDGDVIYKDFFAALTPLSYYLFAGIYRVAGTTLLAARVGSALIEAVGCALLFHLVRRVAGVLEATLATLIFAGICIPTWPYASPHWISTTLGLAVAAVTLAERWPRSARARALVAGMLTGIAFCVQQQRGAFLALWVPLALLVLGFSRPHSSRWRTVSSEIAWSTGSAVAVVLVVLGQAAWASSLTTVVDRVFGFSVKYYGPKHAARNPWADVLAMTQTYRASTWLWLLRVSPLFVVGETLLFLRGGRRPRERPDLERACLCLLALLMALSVWYLPDFIHVSFVLPFLLIPGATLLHRLRSAALWDRVPAVRHAVTVGVGLFSLAVVYQGAVNVASAYALVPERLETGFGAVRVDDGMARLFRAVHSHLVREPDGRSLLYSYPDDAWLYLVLPTDDATRYSILYPNLLPDEDVEEAIGVLRARRPGTVVLAVAFSSGPVGTAIEEGYDAVQEVDAALRYRIYVRRETPQAPVPGAVE